jgi:hypothetical protein
LPGTAIEIDWNRGREKTETPLEFNRPEEEKRGS